MSNTLRTLKRRRDKAQEAELPLDQQKLPVARVLTEPIRGEYVSFPLLAWTAIRERDRVPLVMLVLALLGPDEGMCGTLEVELPIYPETEAATLVALERYGWTGGDWSLGDAPPLDNTELGEQLKGLLGQTSTKLRRTLLFVPDPVTGNTLAQVVAIGRAKGRFLMPPLESPKEAPDEGRLKLLRTLVRDYRSFFVAEVQEVTPNGVGAPPT